MARSVMKAKPFFPLHLPIVAGQQDILLRIDQLCITENLSETDIPLIIDAVAGQEGLFMVDPGLLAETGNIQAGVVPAVFAVDRVPPVLADNVGRAEKEGCLRYRIVHERVGIHVVFRLIISTFSLKKKLLFNPYNNIRDG